MREPVDVRAALLLTCVACTTTPKPDGIVVASDQHVAGLAIDSNNLYWTTREGSVMEMPLDGSSAPVALVSGLSAQPWGIAVMGHVLYWTNLGALDRSATGSVMTFDLSLGQPATLVPDQQNADLIAVGATTVFWTTANEILSVPLGGGPPTTLAPGEGGLGDDIDAIAIDATNAYFIRYHPHRAPLGGGPAIDLFPGVPGGDGAIAVDASNVYWTLRPGSFCDVPPCNQNHDAAVIKGPLGGGEAVKLADYETPGYPVTQLAVDASYVYWTSAHELNRVPIGGGPVETLAANEGDPYAMVLSDTDVYWATGPSNGEPAAIRKIAK